jgi:hypothetical protein
MNSANEIRRLSWYFEVRETNVRYGNETSHVSVIRFIVHLLVACGPRALKPHITLRNVMSLEDPKWHVRKCLKERRFWIWWHTQAHNNLITYASTQQFDDISKHKTIWWHKQAHNNWWHKQAHSNSMTYASTRQFITVQRYTEVW